MGRVIYGYLDAIQLNKRHSINYIEQYFLQIRQISSILRLDKI